VRSEDELMGLIRRAHKVHDRRVAEGTCFAPGEAVPGRRARGRRPAGTPARAVGDGLGRTPEKRPRPSEG
jgi:hypothetical protein